jgi:predicted transposase YbfD/YdcC
MTELFDEARISIFYDIDDPRASYNQWHRLTDILVIAICSVISGADGWNDMETFGLSRYDWLQTFLPLPHGIPSHDTFQRVLSALDPAQFSNCFLRWTQSLVPDLASETIAIDGKRLRHSGDSTIDKSPIHMVSAWASSHGLVLAQLKTAEKSNEITAIPALLEVLALEGATVTIDAMGCQTEIVETIVNRKADYTIALKDNQHFLYADVMATFSAMTAGTIDEALIDRYETIEQHHGRLEQRIYTTTVYLDGLRTRGDWRNLQTLVQIESIRSDANSTSSEKRYYISSTPNDAKQIALDIRNHWGIENRVHWILDVVFREDDSRITSGHGAQNFAILRHIALNLLRKELTFKKSVRQKRYRATLDQDYLKLVLDGLQ